MDISGGSVLLTTSGHRKVHCKDEQINSEMLSSSIKPAQLVYGCSGFDIRAVRSPQHPGPSQTPSLMLEFISRDSRDSDTGYHFKDCSQRTILHLQFIEKISWEGMQMTGDTYTGSGEMLPNTLPILSPG